MHLQSGTRNFGAFFAQFGASIAKAIMWALVAVFACFLAFEAVTPARAEANSNASVQLVAPQISISDTQMFTEQTFAAVNAATSPAELTPELLSNYIANRPSARLQNSALDQANALAIGSFVTDLGFNLPPVPQEKQLTEQLLQSYVSASFVSTQQLVGAAETERHCLAQAIYHEARGEPESGQWAVAQVILNRVKSSRYPSTYCGVVFQNASLRNRCQFSFACDGIPDTAGQGNILTQRSWSKAIAMAKTVYQEDLKGELEAALPGSVLFYHNRSVNPRWSRAMRRVANIGAHIFYASN